MNDKKHSQWLHDQLPLWVSRQIIQQEQAEQIADLYPPPASNNVRTVFSVLGAVIFGLGIILFFAYNWQAMHRFAKMGLVLAGIFGTQLASLWFGRQQHPAASEGLSILGTLLFGAGIWLVSQIYHIDNHYPNAFCLWGFSTAAMAWASQSKRQCEAAIMLLFTWGWMEIMTFRQPFHTSPWWLLATTAPLAWKLSSPRLLVMSVGGFLTLWIMSIFEDLHEVALFVLFATAMVLMQASQLSLRLGRQTQLDGLSALALPAWAIYLSTVFALTFVHFIDRQQTLHLFDTALQTRFFWAALVTSLLLPLLAILPVPGTTPLSETGFIHTVLILVTSIIVFLAGPGWITLSYGLLSGVMNLIFIGHCCLFILQGSQLHNRKYMSAGAALFALLVFARYTDLFESLLARSLAFLALGACLFLLGNFYSRNKTSQASGGETP